MAKVSEVYGGEGRQFLNAALCEELGLWGQELTIYKAEIREIRDRPKIVLQFAEIEEELPLNKTNAEILAENYGDDTDDWLMKKIILRKVKRTFQGKLVDAIEVVPLEQEIDVKKAVKKGAKKK